MQPNMLNGRDEMYLSQNLNVLIAMRNGDFSVKIPTLSHCKVWMTGCGTGEEVVSLAILFSEGNCLKT